MKNKKAHQEEPINDQQEKRHQKEGEEEKGTNVKPKAELYLSPADGRPMPSSYRQ